MATLAGNTIASTYPLLLKIDSSGIDGTLRAVQDGDATDSALSIATDSVLVKGSGVRLYFHDADGGEHIAGDGTDLTITSGNDIKLAVGSAGSVHSSGVGGTGNTVLGIDAGIGLESGSDYNVFIGDLTGDSVLNNALYSVGVGYGALSSLTTGDRNTALGYLTLTACTTGEENIAIGRNSMDACVSGSYNIGIGTNTLGATADVASTFNIAIGYDAMSTANHADIDECIAIGHSTLNALAANSGATGSIAIGKESLTALTTGAGNVGIGQHTLSVETDGNYSTAIGFQALQQQESGSTATVCNTAVGYRAGRSLTSSVGVTLMGYLAGGNATMTGANNTVIGAESGIELTSGNDNTIVGMQAGDAMTTGEDNTIIGKSAFTTANGDEDFNTVIGMNAGLSIDNDSADNNVIIGYNAGIGGSGQFARNIAIGVDALNSTAGNELTATIAIGYEAGTAINHSDASGTVMVGHQAGAQITSGQYNVLIGQQSGNQGANGITTGDYNTAVGTKTLGASAASNITGNGNVAVGYEALLESEGAVNNNTAVGFKAGQNITTAEHNTAVGTTALQTLVTGNSNTMIGSSAGTALPAGAEQNTAVGREALAAGNSSDTDNNVCVGYRAGYQIQAGSGNTLIGTGVDVNTSNYTNSTGIGYNFEVSSSNAVFLGNADVTDVYMGSDSGAKVRCGVIVASQTADTYAAEIYGTASASSVTFINKASSGTYITWGTGGVAKGTISESGGTVSYGAFTAHHDAELPSPDNDDGYAYGTLVETTEIVYTQEDGVDSERGIVYKVQKSSSAYAKNVLGSYSDKYPTPDYPNLHRIYVLGDGHILCNGEKGNISVGDGICSSSTVGQGMKADKKTMIIGIAQEDVSFSGNESKLVVVQYGLQQFTTW